MPEQARIVAATLDKLQLKQPVHVVGHSMGGAIAANLAAATPQHVKTLVLMNAAGVESPQPSSMARELAKGNNPLIVRGPGAGPDVTAAGVFADLLRVASGLGAAL